MFHLLIGTKILINTKSEQLEESIFDIVSQVSQRSSLQTEGSRRESTNDRLTKNQLTGGNILVFAAMKLTYFCLR